MTELSANIPISAFECQLCLSLLCEPVTIACGHTFCRTCLVSTLDRSKKRCPVCRTPCHFEAKGRIVNVLLANILQTYFPTQYDQRLEEVKQMEESFKAQIPLFCFNEVLFPNQPFRLHFFEPRYRLMVRRALESNRQFGFCSAYEPKAGMIGTVAEIRECEFLADGRSLVLCEGKTRFKVVDTWVEESTEGLWYAKVDFFEDSLGSTDNTETSELHEKVVQKLELFLSQVQEDKRLQIIHALGPIPLENSLRLSMWISSMLPASLSVKTVLLNTTSTNRRLKYVLQSLNILLGNVPTESESDSMAGSSMSCS